MSILFNVIYKVKVTSIKMPGNPLKIQWLGRKCSHCWGQGSFPGQGTKIPRAVQLSSVTQSCRTLFDPMDCSTPGFPVLHHLPELAETQVHWISDGHPTISSSVVPFSSCLQSFSASGSFQTRQFLASGGQSVGASASASVLPVNIQDWSPLGWTGWISLLSKGLSRVFSSITVQKHQLFGI